MRTVLGIVKTAGAILRAHLTVTGRVWSRVAAEYDCLDTLDSRSAGQSTDRRQNESSVGPLASRGHKR